MVRFLKILSAPFYDFPKSPILMIGALDIAVAIAFFLSRIENISIRLSIESGLKKKALIKEQKD